MVTFDFWYCIWFLWKFFFSSNTLKTSTQSNAQSAGPIYGRILTGSSWSDWRRLDNTGCDDFESGNTDYFNEFNDITSNWDAVALYNCGTDGWLMDNLGYYDGNNGIIWINSFCSNIGGPGKSCGADGTTGQFCSPGSDTSIPRWNSIWIDQDQTACSLVVVNTINNVPV